jgi:hypothetical protein
MGVSGAKSRISGAGSSWNNTRISLSDPVDRRKEEIDSKPNSNSVNNAKGDLLLAEI